MKGSYQKGNEEGDEGTKKEGGRQGERKARKKEGKKYSRKLSRLPLASGEVSSTVTHIALETMHTIFPVIVIIGLRVRSQIERNCAYPLFLRNLRLF